MTGAQQRHTIVPALPAHLHLLPRPAGSALTSLSHFGLLSVPQPCSVQACPPTAAAALARGSPANALQLLPVQGSHNLPATALALL